MTKVRFVAIALLGFALAGCATAQKLGDFTLLSSRNVELSRAGEFTQTAKEVKGSAVNRWLFGIAIKSNAIDLKGSVDAALSKIPGAVAVVDPRLSYKTFSIPFIFGSIYRSEGYYITGTALVDPKRAGQ